MKKSVLESLVKDVIDFWRPETGPGGIVISGNSRSRGKAITTSKIVELVKDGTSQYVLTESKSVYKLGKPEFSNVKTIEDIKEFMVRAYSRSLGRAATMQGARAHLDEDIEDQMIDALDSPEVAAARRAYRRKASK